MSESNNPTIEPKYELFEEPEDGLYRIRALRDFGRVKKGDIGGRIVSEECLSHLGECWVYDNARIYRNCVLKDNAVIGDSAVIINGGTVHGNAKICGNAMVSDKAEVYGNATILSNSLITHNAHVYGNATVRDSSSVSGYARVFGRANVMGNSDVRDKGTVFDGAIIDSSVVSGNAVVRGNAKIISASVCGDAVVFDNQQVLHYCEVDLSNIVDSIRCQTGLAVFNSKIICYKRVRGDLTSLFDKDFKYVVGEYMEVLDAEQSNESCTSGLHFSNATYWDNSVHILSNTKLLICEVALEDVITCQQGKIRAKRCLVLGICD